MIEFSSVAFPGGRHLARPGLGPLRLQLTLQRWQQPEFGWGIPWFANANMLT